MSVIGFANSEDATDLISALVEEGYAADLQPGDLDAPAPWVLTVDPFDEHVLDMVDVYGGWIPGDVQHPEG